MCAHGVQWVVNCRHIIDAHGKGGLIDKANKSLAKM